MERISGDRKVYSERFLAIFALGLPWPWPVDITCWPSWSQGSGQEALALLVEKWSPISGHSLQKAHIAISCLGKTCFTAKAPTQPPTSFRPNDFSPCTPKMLSPQPKVSSCKEVLMKSITLHDIILTDHSMNVQNLQKFLLFHCSRQPDLSQCRSNTLCCGSWQSVKQITPTLQARSSSERLLACLLLPPQGRPLLNQSRAHPACCPLPKSGPMRVPVKTSSLWPPKNKTC